MTLRGFGRRVAAQRCYAQRAFWVGTLSRWAGEKKRL